MPGGCDNEDRMNAREVVVVGGGVAGLGVAWRLAQRGIGVTVVDAEPGSGASHAAAGMIAPVSESTFGEERLLALAVESARRWPGFAAELEDASGRSVGYRSDGTLVVGLDADDNRALDVLYGFQREHGLEVQRLRGSECRELEPALAPGVRGGVLVPGDHQVDNRATTAALLVAAERAGVRFVHRRARGLRVEGGRCVGVRVERGDDLEADAVVLAAGAWSARVPGLPREAVPPVRPVKGQILRLAGRRGAPLLTRSVRGLARGRPVYFVPRADAGLVVGGTVEEQGYDVTVTVEAMREVLDTAFDVVPGVDDLELVEASAGLRPGTPDNAPILGPSAVEGLVMATGHFRHGFLLLPVTADSVADVVATGDVPGEIAPFSPLRFVGEGIPA